MVKNGDWLLHTYACENFCLSVAKFLRVSNPENNVDFVFFGDFGNNPSLKVALKLLDLLLAAVMCAVSNVQLSAEI